MQPRVSGTRKGLFFFSHSFLFFLLKLWTYIRTSLGSLSRPRRWGVHGSPEISSENGDQSPRQAGGERKQDEKEESRSHSCSVFS
ncbi:hypothetical protein F4809DRAFT_149705 [Biscogniauxia mediterranea]|nr:hypothetical protein F4809DRAFT_149705 [Biscogniauxia mediterranea]